MRRTCTFVATTAAVGLLVVPIVALAQASPSGPGGSVDAPGSAGSMTAPVSPAPTPNTGAPVLREDRFRIPPGSDDRFRVPPGSEDRFRVPPGNDDRFRVPPDELRARDEVPPPPITVPSQGSTSPPVGPPPPETVPSQGIRSTAPPPPRVVPTQ